MRKLLKLSNKKTHKPIKKQAKNLNRHLIKEDTQVANKNMKRCLTSYAFGEKCFKTTMRISTHPLEWSKSETLRNPNIGEEVEQQEL